MSGELRSLSEGQRLLQAEVAGVSGELRSLSEGQRSLRAELDKGRQERHLLLDELCAAGTVSQHFR